MGILDDLASLRAQRNLLAKAQWSVRVPSVRIFDCDGRNTREMDVPTTTLDAAMSVVEHEHSAYITYCAGYAVGKAVQQVVLRYLDKRIKDLSQEAAKEAAAVLGLMDPVDAAKLIAAARSAVT